ELEEALHSTRPVVIPEVQRFGEHDKRIRVLLMNVGPVSALNVRIDKVQAIGSVAEFETVQVLRPEDGRVEVNVRLVQAHDVGQVLGSVHLVAALRLQREGKAGQDFVVPMRLTYSDPTGQTYEDDTFCFAWIPSVTRAPIDTELIVRRLHAGEAAA